MALLFYTVRKYVGIRGLIRGVVQVTDPVIRDVIPPPITAPSWSVRHGTGGDSMARREVRKEWTARRTLRDVHVILGYHGTVPDRYSYYEFLLEGHFPFK